MNREQHIFPIEFIIEPGEGFFCLFSKVFSNNAQNKRTQNLNSSVLRLRALPQYSGYTLVSKCCLLQQSCSFTCQSGKQAMKTE